MSANKSQPHVLVLPEDDANRQLAKGFQLDLDPCVLRQMDVRKPAGGWLKVLDCFEEDHVADMDRHTNRYMVLLIDFDQHEDRLTIAKGKIPERLRDRVFIIGAWSKPEALRPDLGSYETIGRSLAKECREETATARGWGHNLLRHNTAEFDRLRQHVRPILFD
jgi:hypothetical protein